MRNTFLVGQTTDPTAKPSQLFLLHAECGGQVKVEWTQDCKTRYAQCSCGILTLLGSDAARALLSVAHFGRPIELQPAYLFDDVLRFEPMPAEVERCFHRTEAALLRRIEELEEAGRRFSEAVHRTRRSFKSRALKEAREEFEQVLDREW